MGSGAVKAVEPAYFDLVGVCNYTGKRPDQIEHAFKNGHLKKRKAADGSLAFSKLSKYPLHIRAIPNCPWP